MLIRLGRMQCPWKVQGMSQCSTSTFILDLKHKNLLSVSHLLKTKSDSALGLTPQAPCEAISHLPWRQMLSGELSGSWSVGRGPGLGPPTKGVQALSFTFTEHLHCTRFLPSRQEPLGGGEDQLIHYGAVILPTCPKGESFIYAMAVESSQDIKW